MTGADDAMTESIAQESAARVGRRWTTLAVWIAVFALLAVLGIGLVRSQQGPIGVGTRIPDFSLTTFDGQTVTRADLEGKVAVINFWASWCKPCEQEAAELEQAWQLTQDRGVVFLGVNYVDTETEARAYLAKFGITYLNGPDLGTRISQAFRIGGVPETFVVRPDGTIDSVKIGPFRSLDEILDAIDSAGGGD